MELKLSLKELELIRRWFKRMEESDYKIEVQEWNLYAKMSRAYNMELDLKERIS